jgi:hypothetical protein
MMHFFYQVCRYKKKMFLDYANQDHHQKAESLSVIVWTLHEEFPLSLKHSHITLSFANEHR